MQQGADRRGAKLGAGQPRHVGRRRIVDGVDGSLGDGDTHQHGSDGLGHRLRQQAIAVGAGVLVVLEQDGPVPDDQQPGDRMALHVVGQRMGLAAIDVREFDLGRSPGKRRGNGGGRYAPIGKQLLGVAERPHQVALLPLRPDEVHRVAFGLAVGGGIGTGGRKHRDGIGMGGAGEQRQQQEQKHRTIAHDRDRRRHRRDRSDGGGGGGGGCRKLAGVGGPWCSTSMIEVLTWPCSSSFTCGRWCT